MKARDRIVRMGAALRSARRLLKQYRDADFDSYTIPPDRSFDHMNKLERQGIRQQDRVIAKIDAALSSHKGAET